MEPPDKRFVSSTKKILFSFSPSFSLKIRPLKGCCPFLGFLAVGFFALISLGLISFLSTDDESFLRYSFFEGQDKNEIFLNAPLKFQPESPDLIFVSQNSLKSAAPAAVFSSQALGALVGGHEVEDVKNTVIEYIVEQGDSVWSITDKFDISLNTVLWANNLTKNSILKIGQKLIIPPVSGVIHHVKSGDTVSGIAQSYKGKSEDIVSFNRLSDEGGIYVGDIIIIPNGTPPAPSVRQQAPTQVPLPGSYFICPVAGGCRITQRLHWYNAIDFSNGKCGELILAAAEGEVIKVALTNSTSQWAFGGAGNHITILHPNGVVTMYGHIASSLVKQGDRVSQGQPIALMGGQPRTPGAGLSTGCHLHFGVSGARNPFNR